jgi:hypothetical protein
MTTIGGKHRKPNLPDHPQVIIQIASHINQYAVFGVDAKKRTTIEWVGDPNAATKFNSKYEAKSRTRDMEEIPISRVFKVLERATA